MCNCKMHDINMQLIHPCIDFQQPHRKSGFELCLHGKYSLAYRRECLGNLGVVPFGLSKEYHQVKQMNCKNVQKYFGDEKITSKSLTYLGQVGERGKDSLRKLVYMLEAPSKLFILSYLAPVPQHCCPKPGSISCLLFLEVRTYLESVLVTNFQAYRVKNLPWMFRMR